MRKNIKDKLHECNIASQLVTEILDDIFGRKVGSVYVKGLVDASNTDEFDVQVERLVTKWVDSAQSSTCELERFIDWFQSYKAPVIRGTMIASIREECGLGSPPAPFTTNASETANYMLKHKVNYRRSELPTFLKELKELIHDQQCEVEKAVIGRGKFELRDQYRFLHVAETKWFSMSSSQRESHLKRFAATALCDVGDDKNICVGRDVSASFALSVQVDSFASDVRVPRSSLEGIWSKAAELLKTDGAIVTAPGVGVDAKYVLSYSGRKPHLVVPTKEGGFKCDSDCPNWKALGICSHCVAVGEMCNKLVQVVNSFKKVKKAPNLTKFAEATMPKGRGRKGGSVPRKRKRSSAIDTVVENPVTVSAALPCSAPESTSTLVQGSSVAPVSPNDQPLVSLQTTFNVSSISNSQPVFNVCGTSSSTSGGQPTLQALQCSSPVTTLNPVPQWPLQFAPPPPPTQQAFTLSPAASQFPPPLPPSQQTFTLCRITGNISVCIGCRGRYQKSALPPDDMCIQHQEWREYSVPSSPMPQFRFGNVYYHFNPTCVWSRCHWFVPCQLQIPANLSLNEVHKYRLSSLFNIQL